MEITEEEDENTEITGVDQNIEYPGVNHTTGAKNAMPGSLQDINPTNDNNISTVDMVDEPDTQ